MVRLPQSRLSRPRRCRDTRLTRISPHQVPTDRGRRSPLIPSRSSCSLAIPRLLLRHFLPRRLLPPPQSNSPMAAPSSEWKFGTPYTHWGRTARLIGFHKELPSAGNLAVGQWEWCECSHKVELSFGMRLFRFLPFLVASIEPWSVVLLFSPIVSWLSTLSFLSWTRSSLRLSSAIKKPHVTFN